MRIAYFIDTVIPSSRANTVHVMRMCQALTNEGNTVSLYCDRDSTCGDVENIWGKYGISNKFEIVQIQLPEFVRKYGHRFSNILSAKLKAKKAKNYDVAYARSAYALDFIKKSHKFIFESHTEPDAWNLRYEKRILSHKNCLGLVVISEALKKRYLELLPFLSSDKITVLHDCADINVSDTENKAQLRELPDKKRIKIGYVGHLYPGKCMEVLLPIAEARKEYCFHIVGGTDEWISYWKKETEKKKLDNIIFYGFVDNSKIGDYYRAFDIAILPFSKSVLVGTSKSLDIGKWISPLKLFEAMSYKKAIVVSSLPTIKEVMEDNKDALLADPDNLREWTDQLDKLVNDSELRNSLGNKAFEKLKNNYTWTKRAKAIVEILENK